MMPSDLRRQTGAAAMLAAFAALCGLPASAVANPFLAASDWPMAHRDPAQRAASPVPGPLGRPLVQRYRTQADAGVRFGTSPWHVISGATYPRAPGTRTLWGASLTHAYKYVLAPEGLRFAGSFELTRFGSIAWNLIALRSDQGARIIVPQPRGLRRGGAPCRGRAPALIELGDGPSPGDPIRCTRRIDLSDAALRRVCPIPAGRWRQGYSATRAMVAASGEIVTNAVYLRRGSLGAEQRSFMVLVDNALSRIVACADMGPGRSTNNTPSEPLPGGGTAFYVATETALTRIDWEPSRGQLAIRWKTPLALRTRTGTTPTLVDAGPDRFVVLVDGICAVTRVFTGRIDCADASTGPSRLIAVDRRTGAATATDLPAVIRTVENSPPAANGTVVIANYGGYRAAPGVTGVVAMTWDRDARRWRTSWVNDRVQMNGVPTISTGSNAVYSSGIGPTGQVEMLGLGLAGASAGQVVMRTPVGDPADWLDAGVNTVIAGDGALIYGADAGLIRIVPGR